MLVDMKHIHLQEGRFMAGYQRQNQKPGASRVSNYTLKGRLAKSPSLRRLPGLLKVEQVKRGRPPRSILPEAERNVVLVHEEF